MLTGITKDMAAYREELFGPVAVVYKVGSDDEALALANDTTYGLGGAVFSTDPERARGSPSGSRSAWPTSTRPPARAPRSRSVA